MFANGTNVSILALGTASMIPNCTTMFQSVPVYRARTTLLLAGSRVVGKVLELWIGFDVQKSGSTDVAAVVLASSLE
jgi:hypothetical protein